MKNYRRNANAISPRPVARLAVGIILLVTFGLLYLNVKLRNLASAGVWKRQESTLENLEKRYGAVRMQIAYPQTRQELQRRLEQGYMDLVKIPDSQIVRISARPWPEPGSEVRRVGYRGGGDG